MIDAGIKKRLCDIVGQDHVLDSELGRFGYSYDSSFVPLIRLTNPISSFCL